MVISRVVIAEKDNLDERIWIVYSRTYKKYDFKNEKLVIEILNRSKCKIECKFKRLNSWRKEGKTLPISNLGILFLPKYTKKS